MIHSRKTWLCLMLLVGCIVAGSDATSAHGQSTTQAVYSTSATNPGSNSQPVSVSIQPAATAVRYSSGYFLPTEGYPPTEPALVIPAKDTDAEATKRIIEDLSIMSRIIEKNSLSSFVSTDADSQRLLGQLFRPVRENSGPEVLFSSVGRPRPLYVAGYGATFFIRVNFPLLAPQVEEEAPAEETTDTVWAQTRQSLFDPRPARPLSGGDPDTQEPYSREKVDTLKRMLIATMKHATNVRVLEPREWLTIVVQGTSPKPNRQPDDSPEAPDARIADGRSVLILRAVKADIDPYAKGELTPAQFEQRVQVISY